MITEAIEDYLKTIYKLEDKRTRVSTNSLADHLGIAAASVTGMLKKLAGLKLVSYQPYRGVQLTRQGRQRALKVLRHHRLVELYLVKVLGMPWDKVHQEAERWEHVISEDVEQKIDAYLGHPSNCPHGAPIPSRSGAMKTMQMIRLDKLKVGQSSKLLEIKNENPELLKYLGKLGLYPGTKLKMLEIEPLGGVITILSGKVKITLGQEIVNNLYVKPVDN